MSRPTLPAIDVPPARVVAPRPLAPPLSPYATLRRVRLPDPEPWTVQGVVEDIGRLVVRAIWLFLLSSLEIFFRSLRLLRWVQ